MASQLLLRSLGGGSECRRVTVDETGVDESVGDVDLQNMKITRNSVMNLNVTSKGVGLSNPNIS